MSRDGDSPRCHERYPLSTVNSPGYAASAKCREVVDEGLGRHGSVEAPGGMEDFQGQRSPGFAILYHVNLAGCCRTALKP